MPCSITRCLLALGLLLALISPALAQSPSLRIALPEVPVPEGASWRWVSNKMVYNGLAMTIKEFEFFGPGTDVERFYENYFASRGLGQHGKRELGPTTSLSFKQRGFFITVQFQEHGSWSKGKVVVSESPGTKRGSKRTGLPVPPGATVISVVESMDAGRHTESVTIEASRSVDFNLQFYDNQLRSRGFHRVFVNDGASRNGVLAHYQKSASQLQITIKNPSGNDRGVTHILIHLTQ